MTFLRLRMIEDMKVRNLAPNTQRIYVDRVAKFAQYFGKSPHLLGPEEIRTYQVYLSTEKNASPSLLNQAVCALRFLYRITLGKRPQRQRRVRHQGPRAALGNPRLFRQDQRPGAFGQSRAEHLSDAPENLA